MFDLFFHPVPCSCRIPLAGRPVDFLVSSGAYGQNKDDHSNFMHRVNYPAIAHPQSAASGTAMRAAPEPRDRREMWCLGIACLLSDGVGE